MNPVPSLAECNVTCGPPVSSARNTATSASVCQRRATLSARIGKLAVLAAVEQAAGMVLAETAQMNAVDNGAAISHLGRHVEPGRPLAPLLEKERHASGGALVAQRPRPYRVHRARLRPGIATADHPVDFSVRLP